MNDKTAEDELFEKILFKMVILQKKETCKYCDKLFEANLNDHICDDCWNEWVRDNFT
jgi:Zn finger protein HypA/HybF involved in hydrogenase expression